ncbi:uncharacterized protein LOC109839154 [Asparagus officinalis]|nr:uncharacterized protein LOC109839154 [Asparagus officinalis]
MEEGVLGYWIDVDREKPEMSALFYIQVTEFQGDGYSIGISCSLLLADPLFLTQFLKKWAVAHCSMLAQAHPKTPMFHLNYFRIPQRPKHLKSIPFDHTQPKPTTKTILFKSNPHQTPRLNHATLASICIKKATHLLDIDPLLKFSLIVNNPNPNGDLTVGSCQGEELVHSDVCDGAVAAASMDEFGLDELAMSEGNVPVHVSCGVVTSCETEGLVVVMTPGYDDGASEVLISVTIPKK